MCAGETIFKAITTEMIDDTLTITSTFEEDSRMKEFTWSFYPNGWAALEIFYLPEKYDVPFDYMGVLL